MCFPTDNGSSASTTAAAATATAAAAAATATSAAAAGKENTPFTLLVTLNFATSALVSKFLAEIQPLCEYIRQHEPTTLSYEVLLSDKDDTMVTLLERYEDKDNAFLKIHRSSVPFQNFRAKLKAMEEKGLVKVDGNSYLDSGVGHVDSMDRLNPSATSTTGTVVPSPAAISRTLPSRHVAKISDLSRTEIASILTLAMKMKANPEAYYNVLQNKTLLMLFEKPSLRTRVSLEAGMTSLGGHAIAYMMGDSPLGVKESYEDTGAVLSRMSDAVTARVKSRDQIAGLAANSTIPIINALDDFAHPMQMLADMQVMMEYLGVAPEETLDGLQDIAFAFVGDLNNNVTYDLMRTGCIMGMNVRVAGPKGEDFAIEQSVLDECAKLSAASPNAGTVEVCDTAEEAVAGADFVYADSWFSYGVKGEEREKRFNQLLPYQVNADLMKHAKSSAKFMNCLPAMRGDEQTAEVIDGPQSIVFDQAENRLHAQKALLVKLIHREII